MIRVVVASRLATASLAFLVALQACAPGEAGSPDTRATPTAPPTASVKANEFWGELGTVQVLEPPLDCNGDDCWYLQITCPGAIEFDRVEVEITDPSPGVPLRGTVVFTKGGAGREFWEEFGAYAQGVMDRLNDQGYRTVQHRWTNGWSAGTDLSEGLHNLSCRGATLFDYLHREISENRAFCGTGNSGGSSLHAYALSHHGLHAIFELVIPTSGPTASSIEYGCLGGDEAWQADLEFPANSKEAIDGSRGYTDNEVGTCEAADETDRAAFRDMDLVQFGGDFEYFYPGTKVHIITGAWDDWNAPEAAALYYDRLLDAGTDVSMVELEHVGHAVPRFLDGVKEIYREILESCKL